MFYFLVNDSLNHCGGKKCVPWCWAPPAGLEVNSYLLQDAAGCAVALQVLLDQLPGGVADLLVRESLDGVDLRPLALAPAAAGAAGAKKGSLFFNEIIFQQRSVLSKVRNKKTKIQGNSRC